MPGPCNVCKKVEITKIVGGCMDIERELSRNEINKRKKSWEGFKNNLVKRKQQLVGACHPITAAQGPRV